MVSISTPPLWRVGGSDPPFCPKKKLFVLRRQMPRKKVYLLYPLGAPWHSDTVVGAYDAPVPAHLNRGTPDRMVLPFSLPPTPEGPCLDLASAFFTFGFFFELASVSLSFLYFATAVSWVNTREEIPRGSHWGT